MDRRIRAIAAVGLAVGLAGAALPASALAANPAGGPSIAPSISAAFTPSSTSPGTVVALTFTITNPNVANNAAAVEPNLQTGTLTSVAFTAALPGSMVVAAPGGGTCAGTTTANDGTQSIALVGGIIGPASSCTISVNVVSLEAGFYTLTTSSVRGSGLTGNTATATLSLGYLAPTITETFGASSIVVGGTTSLTFTVTNPNTVPVYSVQGRTAVRPAYAPPDMGLTGVGFTDTLPAGLVVATPNGLTGTCGGGTITAVAGSSTVTLAGATLAATTSCTFALNVLGVTAGTKTNPTGPVSSTEAAAGTPGSAGLTVGAPAPTQAPAVTLPPTSATGGGPGSEGPLLPIMLLLASIAGLGTLLTLRGIRAPRR